MIFLVGKYSILSNLFDQHPPEIFCGEIPRRNLTKTHQDVTPRRRRGISAQKISGAGVGQINLIKLLICTHTI
jgi:hypothetical protein